MTYNPRELTPIQISALHIGSTKSHNTPHVVLDVIENWVNHKNEIVFPENPELEEMAALCRIKFLQEHGRMPQPISAISIPIPTPTNWPKDYPKSLLSIKSAVYTTCVWRVTQAGLDYHREHIRPFLI